MALLFIIPIVAAAYVLSHRNSLNITTKQHGTFIKPPYGLALHNVDYLYGNTTNGKWTIAYMLPNDCTDTCEQQKTLLRKLHTALGAERDRVTIVTAAGDEPKIEDGSVIIINPLGLYIMLYASIPEQQGLLKDMRRLLKYSHA
ncbi:MAG TPA: hypothetical protein VLG38_05945 [Gammaproteobacteria bacterium]|nr:hypothetical protein [Gammaproteobacteria bacterium]